MTMRIGRITFEDASNNGQGIDPALLWLLNKMNAQNPDEVVLSRSGAQTQGKKEHFSLWRAGKEFVKGIFRPIGTMIKHPLLSIGAIAGTLALASFAPVTIPLMVLGGLALGGYQAIKGLGSAFTNYMTGHYDAAEKAFGDIGEGTFAVGASALGVRQAGAITAEAKATTAALKTATSSADKIKAVETGIEAAVTVRQGSWFNALKETTSLVTSRQGLQSIGFQLNPRSVIANTVAKAKETVRMFKEPPVADVQKSLKAAQQQLGITDKDMPKVVHNLLYEDPSLPGLKIDMSGQGVLGFYNPKTHSLHVQPDGFQLVRGFIKPFSETLAAILDKLPKSLQNFIGNAALKKWPMEMAVPHELTHARQALEIQKLTLRQAASALKKAFPGAHRMERKIVLKGWKFTPNNTTLSAKEV